MTGHNQTTTSRRIELCTWYCVCVVKCSWRMKPSCWTLRRPTTMTTWKPRSRETIRSTPWNSSVTWTRERARSVAVFAVLVLCCHTHLLHSSHGSRCSSVCLIPSHGHRYACMKWAFSLTSLTSSWSSPSSSHSPLSSSSSLSSKCPVHFAKEMGSTDESFSNTLCNLCNLYRNCKMK